jgi:predicted secreted Zn-dependent protease
MDKLIKDNEIIYNILDTIPKHIVDKIVLCNVTEDDIKEIVYNEMFKYIDEHPEKHCECEEISRGPKLTIETIVKHLEKPWNWIGVSNNSKLTIEFLEKHSNKGWKWDTISQNMFSQRFTELVMERLFYIQK